MLDWENQEDGHVVKPKLLAKWGESIDKKRDSMKKLFAIYAYCVLTNKEEGDLIQNKSDMYSAACGAIRSRKEKEKTFQTKTAYAGPAAPDDWENAKEAGGWFAVAKKAFAIRKRSNSSD